MTTAGEVQLYPVWDGEEGSRPKGINVGLDALSRETFSLVGERIVLVENDKHSIDLRITKLQ